MQHFGATAAPSGSGGSSTDLLLSLSMKEAESIALRQQVAQLSDRLQAKETEHAGLMNTIRALQGVVAEKDQIFTELKGEAQELESACRDNARRATDAEQQLADQRAAWAAQAAAREARAEGEAAAMRAAVLDTEGKALAQVRR
jgi:hypothetical protein